MAADTFRSRTPLRVRWAEVDPQGIVFNANYLTYVDTASTEYWRQVGLPYPDALSELGGDIVVKKATLEFLRPARFDDVVEVGLRCARIGRSSLTFVWTVSRAGLTLVTGELVYVFVDPQAERSLAVPDPLRATLEAFEAGEAMFEVRVGDWNELGERARSIRETVFIEEQGVARNLEEDGEDPSCQQVVVANRFGAPVATARLCVRDSSTVQVGRIAVRRQYRRSGVGRVLMERMVGLARAGGARRLVLHAQLQAAGFFERVGFHRYGKRFEEASIPHIEMRLDL